MRARFINEAIKHLKPVSKKLEKEYNDKILATKKIMDGYISNDIDLFRKGIIEGGDINQYSFLSLTARYPPKHPNYDFACKVIEALLQAGIIDKDQLTEAFRQMLKNKAKRMLKIIKPYL